MPLLQTMEDKQFFFVESTDGRKFKMVMKGDLGKISVAKIHRYLQSYGVPHGQLLTFCGEVLQDDMVGEDFGLTRDATLQLRDASRAPTPSAHAKSATAVMMTREATPHAPVTEVAHIVAAAEDATPPHGAAAVVEAHTAPQLTTTTISQSTMSASQGGEVVAENAHLRQELDESQAQVQRLEAQMRQQQNEMHHLRMAAAEIQPVTTNPAPLSSSYSMVEPNPLKNAKENLEALGRKMGVPLQLDVNLTCIIGTDKDYTILVSFDPETERLYMYSTLVNHLPDSPEVRMKLYEVLLEGSLLGREVCGGSLSISLREGIVVLTTSLFMGHCDSGALVSVMPHFVNTLTRWRSIVKEFQ